MVRVLVEEANADVNQRNGPNNGFALEVASYFGHAPIVCYLLSNGAEVNMRNNEGLTALDLAKSQGHDMAMQALENPDTNCQTNQASQNGAPLYLASKNGQLVGETFRHENYSRLVASALLTGTSQISGRKPKRQNKRGSWSQQ